MNYKEMGEYVIIKKTEFEKLQKVQKQYENKKEFSRNYMRAKYAKQKLEKEKQKESDSIDLTEEELLFHLEHTS
jgi:hypothetical protein